MVLMALFCAGIRRLFIIIIIIIITMAFFFLFFCLCSSSNSLFCFLINSYQLSTCFNYFGVLYCFFFLVFTFSCVQISFRHFLLSKSFSSSFFPCHHLFLLLPLFLLYPLSSSFASTTTTPTLSPTSFSFSLTFSPPPSFSFSFSSFFFLLI